MEMELGLIRYLWIYSAGASVRLSNHLELQTNREVTISNRPCLAQAKEESWKVEPEWTPINTNTNLDSA
jgi:hypothetical protein